MYVSRKNRHKTITEFISLRIAMTRWCSLGCPERGSRIALSGLFDNEGESMPWWVDVAYVVGTVVFFVLVDLFGKWVDRL